MLASDLGTYSKHRHDPNYQTLGATGAVLAVLFASIVYSPSASILILPIPIPIPAPVFAVACLSYSYYASRHARGGINHDAHLAGAVAGIAFVALTEPTALLISKEVQPRGRQEAGMAWPERQHGRVARESIADRNGG